MHRFILVLVVVIILTGCAAADDPGRTAEAYFQALVDDDTARLADLTCTAFEAQAQANASSFRGTGARLVDLQCQLTTTETTYSIVTCRGKIVIAYQGEDREFPLGQVQMIQQEGSWRMCGEG
jgi:hypothetical protein